jgi:hypothetical protein
MLATELWLRATGAAVRSWLDAELGRSPGSCFEELQSRLKQRAPLLFAWQAQRLQKHLPGSVPLPVRPLGFRLAPIDCALAETCPSACPRIPGAGSERSLRRTLEQVKTSRKRHEDCPWERELRREWRQASTPLLPELPGWGKLLRWVNDFAGESLDEAEPPAALGAVPGPAAVPAPAPAPAPVPAVAAVPAAVGPGQPLFLGLHFGGCCCCCAAAVCVLLVVAACLLRLTMWPLSWQSAPRRTPPERSLSWHSKRTQQNTCHHRLPPLLLLLLRMRQTVTASQISSR